MTNQTEQIVTKAEAESYVSPGLAVKPALYRTARSYLKAMEALADARAWLGCTEHFPDGCPDDCQHYQTIQRTDALIAKYEGGTENERYREMLDTVRMHLAAHALLADDSTQGRERRMSDTMETTAGESTCPMCGMTWTVTLRRDCLLPACGCYDTSAANPARPCERCGINHALDCPNLPDFPNGTEE